MKKYPFLILTEIKNRFNIILKLWIKSKFLQYLIKRMKSMFKLKKN